ADQASLAEPPLTDDEENAAGAGDEPPDFGELLLPAVHRLERGPARGDALSPGSAAGGGGRDVRRPGRDVAALDRGAEVERLAGRRGIEARAQGGGAFPELTERVALAPSSREDPHQHPMPGLGRRARRDPP